MTFLGADVNGQDTIKLGPYMHPEADAVGLDAFAGGEDSV